MVLPRFIRRVLWVWAFFIALLIGAAFLGTSVPVEEGDASSVELVDPSGIVTMVEVDIADEPEEWETGLMHKAVVERGMLFAFGDDAPRSFWMKNTLVPLDISFFTSDGTWVSSARMEPCIADPCAVFPSAGPAAYALEFPAGGIGQGIGSGWRLSLKY